MVSVIVCSINKKLAEQVRNNIDDTIGVPWELVLIDNTEMKGSIAHVYNYGAQRARYDLLCFVHEDVLFKNKSWGKTVSDLFENDKQLGVLGVAGAKYKSKTLSGWYTGVPDFDCCNILHLNARKEEQLIYANPDPGKEMQEVVCVDGVFICVRKQVWTKVLFNESLLRGFHCYDIDFSVRAAKLNKVAVTYKIDIVHLTEGGSFGNDWIDNTILWHDAYGSLLPCSLTSLGSRKQKHDESRITRNWLLRLKHEPITRSRKSSWIGKSGALFHIRLWPAVMMFLGFRLYKKIAAPNPIKR